VAMNISRLPLPRLRTALILALGYGLAGCMSLAVGTAATAVKLGGAAVNVGVSVGKTVVKTGAAVAVDLAVPD
jgi:hypothetical protein